MNTVNSNSPSFQSGLNYKLYKKIKSMDVGVIEENFAKIGVDADFNSSKTLASASSFVSEIMNEASIKYNVPFYYNPSSIYVYKKSELAEHRNPNVIGFVTDDSRVVIKNKKEYPANSMFLRKMLIDSPLLMDFDASAQYRFENFQSTSHFLHDVMHEWFHNIHLNIVFKQLGFDGKCPVFKSKYPSPNPKANVVLDALDDIKFSPDEIYYANKNFGKYSCFQGSLLELFAEAMTKFTVNSLDENLRVIKNPLDNLPKDLPKRFKKLFEVTLEK